MIFNKLVLDYIKQRKLLFTQYILVVFLTFPAETIIISRMYSELFNNLKKKNTDLIKNRNIIIAIIISWCVIILFFYIKNHLHAKIIPDYLSFIRSRIFTSTIEFYKTSYKDIKIGKFISRVLGLARIIKGLMINILEYVFPLLLAIICINIYFYFLNPTVALISLVGFIIGIIGIYLLAPKCINTSAEKENKFIDMSEKLHDSFSNLMNVYLNNEDQNEIKKNKEIENKQSQLLKKQYNVVKEQVLFLSIVSAITFSTIILYSYYIYTKGLIDGKYLINILVILIGYFSYLIKLSKVLPQCFVELGIIKNSKLFLDLILGEKKRIKTSNYFKKGNILFNNISFRYPGSKTPLFKNVTVEIKNNEKVAIMGTSGSGKTSLTKLLLKMYTLESGNILVNKKNINQIDTTVLRNHINYINQRTVLFNDTVINNIKYGNDTPTPIIIKKLKKYKLYEIYNGLHNGVNELAGVNGGNLSLGMQKITMIMRGLLRKGDIVVYDEPLAGLDNNTRQKVIKLILDSSVNKTIIIITHNKEIIPFMDRIININNLKNN